MLLKASLGATRRSFNRVVTLKQRGYRGQSCSPRSRELTVSGRKYILLWRSCCRRSSQIRREDLSIPSFFTGRQHSRLPWEEIHTHTGCGILFPAGVARSCEGVHCDTSKRKSVCILLDINFTAYKRIRNVLHTIQDKQESLSV